MYSLHFNWKETNKTNFFSCRFNIVGQENLGNYSCTFGDEAGIDFAFRGKDPSKYICHITCSRLTKTVLFGFTSHRITTVILTICAYDALCLVHKRHWTVNMTPLWCDRAFLTSGASVPAPLLGEQRDKPIVSYVGDTVVIMCKMEDSKPEPSNWTWYKHAEQVGEQLWWGFLISAKQATVARVARIPPTLFQEAGACLFVLFLVWCNFNHPTLSSRTCSTLSRTGLALG